MKRIFIFTLIVLIGHQIVSAQKTKLLPSRIDTVYISSKDTLFISSLDPLVVRQYSEILERTNSQLGLLTNPYGIMVAVLSFLVTLVTILAAYRVLKQSADFEKEIKANRTKMNDEINKFRGIVQQEVLDYRQTVDNYLKQQDDYLKGITDALKNSENQTLKDLSDRIKTLEQTKSDDPLKIILEKLKSPVVWKATYGANNKIVDVTTIVKIMAHTGEKFYATNEALGGDPCPGIKKKLKVEFSIGNVVYTKDFNEGDLVEL